MRFSIYSTRLLIADQSKAGMESAAMAIELPDRSSGRAMKKPKDFRIALKMGLKLAWSPKRLTVMIPSFERC